MSIFQIEDVKREGAKLIIMLCGVSGGGKTYTAIQIASGIVKGDNSKIGFMDTENRRGKLYADTLSSPFKYGLLTPPFSPDRYIAGIEQFERSGCEVLIIDSGTHEWEGIGGCQDIATSGNPRMPNWNRAKSEHKKFMSKLLSTPMHIILCLRAREKAIPEEVWDDKKQRNVTVYRDMGLQPVTEKNVVFEATVSLMLHDNGRRQDVIKCPAELLPILGRGEGYIGKKEGQQIRQWVDGGEQIDLELDRQRKLLQSASENGLDAFKAAWNALTPDLRKRLGQTFRDECAASAKSFDDMKASSTTEVDDQDALASLQNLAAQPATEAAPQVTEQVQVQPADAEVDDGSPF